MCDRHVATISISVLVLAVSFAAIGSEQDDDLETPTLRGPAPQIALDGAANSISEEEQEGIAALIDSLAKIEDPDYGFAPFMEGAQFAPIKDSAEFDAGLIMIDHGLKTNEALERLVALGPKALPQLLQRITDPTSTRLVMEHGGGSGAQWYDHEIFLNMANPIEVQVKGKHRRFLEQDTSDNFQESRVRKHQVTVGDVCFVIIGQIVNRGYQSARYQPTAFRVINSPTHDAELADIVREIWVSDHPAQTLLDSLLLDYSTNDDELQCGAAMRLLYYFPDKTAEMIAQRIMDFQLGMSDDEDDWDRIFERDGLRIDGFLKAVRTSSHPAIAHALFGVVEQTSNPEIFQAAISATMVKQAPHAIFERMKLIVSQAPPVDQGPFGGEYQVLEFAVRYFPDKSRELFHIYRRHDTLPTLRTAIHALKEPAVPRNWMIRFLMECLDDKRDTGWRYGPDFDRQPIRICDEAAKVLADDFLEGVRFEYEQDPAYLDLQIEKIQRVLAGEKDVSFDVPEPFVLPPDLPQRKAQRMVQLDARVGRIYAISSEETVWAGHGLRGDDGYALETWKIDMETGTTTDRISVDSSPTHASLLPNGPADRIFAYHGDNGGAVLVRDARTGRLLNTIATPFHYGIEFHDPLQIRNLSDVTLCGVDSEWIIAVTPDGTLHSIDVETGEHRVEWQRKSSHLEVEGVRGTSKVLLEGVDSKRLFDVPVKVWDQSTFELKTIEKVPHAGWRAAWGDLAWNNFNVRATLWNLAESREIKLAIGEAPIRSIDCNDDQSRLFILREDGSVEVLAIVEGLALRPVLRLIPPVEEKMNVSLVVGREGEVVFWLGRPHEKTDDQGELVEVPDRTVIAVFRYTDIDN